MGRSSKYRFCSVSLCFVSFRHVPFRFVSFRSVSFRFAVFRFVSPCFVSFRSVSFLFRFSLYRDPFISPDLLEAMDSDVPSCSGAKKRRKSTDQIDDPVFVEFHSNEPLMALLNNSVSALKKRNEFSLCMLKISHCNGMAPKNFSKAFCQTERYKCTDEASSSSSTLSPKHVMLFSMSSIFCYGEELLCSFLKPKSETCLPQRKGAKIALSKLLYFLSEETGGKIYKNILWALLVQDQLLYEILCFYQIFFFRNICWKYSFSINW